MANKKANVAKGECAEKCVICGSEIHGYGHNASPVADGKCCDGCNTDVIVQRIKGSVLPNTDQIADCVEAISGKPSDRFAGEREAYSDLIDSVIAFCNVKVNNPILKQFSDSGIKPDDVNHNIIVGMINDFKNVAKITGEQREQIRKKFR